MEIDIEKLKRMQSLHVAFILIDLRSPSLYAEGHLKGSLNIPHAEFLKKLPAVVPKKDTPIVVYDQDGIAAPDLVTRAEGMGYLNVVHLEGGYKSSY